MDESSPSRKKRDGRVVAGDPNDRISDLETELAEANEYIAALAEGVNEHAGEFGVPNKKRIDELEDTVRTLERKIRELTRETEIKRDSLVQRDKRIREVERERDRSRRDHQRDI